MEEREAMDKVTSSDGITIAFDRLGDGPPVIVVGGQLCDRALTRPTAEELAKHFTVFDYDRRGRGDSSDTAPYAVEREIEDVGALVTGAAGGRRRCTAIPPVLLSPSTAAAGLFHRQARAARAALQPRRRRGPAACY